MPRWYHCAHPPDAERILREGFRWTVPSWAFREFFDLYIETLPPPEIRMIDALAGDYRSPKDIPEAAVRRLEESWRRIYGRGTPIWVAEEPRFWYGSACFEVDLPRDARLLYEGDAAGVLFWIPRPSIEARRFSAVYGPWPLP